MKIQNTKLKIQSFSLKFKIIFSLLTIATFNFALLTFNLDRVYAQSLSLSISPPIFEIMIRPGKSPTQAFKITNDGDPVIVTAKLTELTPSGMKNNPDFQPEAWLTTSNSEVEFGKPFLMRTRETKQLTILINPKKETPEGDYYRILQFTTKPNPELNTSQSSIEQNIGIPLLVTVTNTGFVSKSANIKRFIAPYIMDSFDDLNIQIDVENSGKTYFRPIGTVNLEGPLGRAIFNIIPQAILAGQTKTILAQDSFEAISNNLTLSIPGFFIGKYTLKTDFTLDESNIRLTQSKTVYALPWKVVTGIIFIVFLISYFVKRKKTQKHSRSNKV